MVETRPPKKNIDENAVQKKLATNLIDKGHKTISRNSHASFSEADLISVSSSIYMNEYEIKVEQSDFKAEMRAYHGKGNYSRAKHNKHTHIKNTLSDRRGNNLRILPSKYWLVVPEGLIDVDIIPDHWGLYEITEDYTYPDGPVDKVKRADFIHDQKIGDKIMKALGTNLTKRYWDREH